MTSSEMIREDSIGRPEFVSHVGDTSLQHIMKYWQPAQAVNKPVITTIGPQALIDGRRAYLEAIGGLQRDALIELTIEQINSRYFSAALYDE